MMSGCVKEYHISGNQYQTTIKWNDKTAWIADGYFGDIALEEGSLFRACIKDVKSGEKKTITSESIWKSVRVKDHGHILDIRFSEPEGIAELMFAVKGVYDEKGISWSIDVINDNPEWSVMEVDYPTPLMKADYFDMFVPSGSGLEIKDAGKVGFSEDAGYPGGKLCMSYFAVYGKKSGIYIGIEDGQGSVKYLQMKAAENRAVFKATFYGPGGSQPSNTFSVCGCSRWQHIEGDWYDATMLYAHFVRTKANWLPEIGEDGRTDTPRRFKKIPFWVADYIPNSPSQGDNKPMRLSAGSDIYDKGYWVDAVIQLQEELGVPVAYHVYNWHEIPFNIEYPHFLPAKQEFIEGAKKLKEHPIYVIPYINSVSWESRDVEMGHEINFENVGAKEAIIRENGEFDMEPFPQKTVKGETSQLMHMCPSSKIWHTFINNLVTEMEGTLPIDGVYFDQIGATRSIPCYNPSHGHLPGGGSYWVEGYRLMMEKIKAGKPDDNFYFTENNAENYAKSFDGFLTWKWVRNAQVPAFPAVYTGYIEMLGRITMGTKKGDYAFFKYSLAQSLLYGQQLGWCKADIVYDKQWMAFLKQMVHLRYAYTELFHCSDLLRTPKVTSSISAKITSPALGYKEDIVMEQISAGAWRYRNKEKLVLFCINVAEEEGEYELAFSAEEYGLDEYELPEDFCVEDNTCKVRGRIAPESYRVWELRRKHER